MMNFKSCASIFVFLILGCSGDDEVMIEEAFNSEINSTSESQSIDVIYSGSRLSSDENGFKSISIIESEADYDLIASEYEIDINLDIDFSERSLVLFDLGRREIGACGPRYTFDSASEETITTAFDNGSGQLQESVSTNLVLHTTQCFRRDIFCTAVAILTHDYYLLEAQKREGELSVQENPGYELCN